MVNSQNPKENGQGNDTVSGSLSQTHVKSWVTVVFLGIERNPSCSWRSEGENNPNLETCKAMVEVHSNWYLLQIEKEHLMDNWLFLEI